MTPGTVVGISADRLKEKRIHEASQVLSWEYHNTEKCMCFDYSPYTAQYTLGAWTSIFEKSWWNWKTNSLDYICSYWWLHDCSQVKINWRKHLIVITDKGESGQYLGVLIERQNNGRIKMLHPLLLEQILKVVSFNDINGW